MSDRGWKRSVSTPFGTTTAGAGISGANTRRTPSPQQIRRSGGLNAAHARSASRSSKPPSVPPARQTIGIPSCRATGVAAIQENAIAA